ncbi:26188_t:CDS:2 [Dentiscutata erythropus]|uniref:26188_t:CDS:1 n=1 Tax=Dentiscutata erythropus TaxID=1348616 RepID=A0A9N9BUP9_9GLOM|nr:26188_t:CDS:2 [Dentiscutata erythropus]
MGLTIFIIEKRRPDNRTVPENNQFNAIMTFCCAIDIQSLRLISSGFGGYESFSYEFSNDSAKAIAWASVINIFIEDIPQFTILILYKLQMGGFTFIPFVSLILCSCVLATSLERLFHAIDRGPCTGDCFKVRKRNTNQNEEDFQHEWEL